MVLAVSDFINTKLVGWLDGGVDCHNMLFLYRKKDVCKSQLISDNVVHVCVYGVICLLLLHPCMFLECTLL